MLKSDKLLSFYKVLKLLYVMIIAILFSSSYAYADKIRSEYATKNLVGQDYYLNRCSSCHGDGNRGGNMASIREWGQIFSNNALELKELHMDDESTSKVLAYLEGNDFKKESELLLKLLQEFAYDSDNIPTCN